MYKIIDYYTGETKELNGVKFKGYKTEDEARAELIGLQKKLFNSDEPSNKLMYIIKY